MRSHTHTIGADYKKKTIRADSKKKIGGKRLSTQLQFANKQARHDRRAGGEEEEEEEKGDLAAQDKLIAAGRMCHSERTLIRT
jgi:hypothetical protein